MNNWTKLRMTSSANELAAWLESELGDSLPEDWLAWLFEEAEE